MLNQLNKLITTFKTGYRLWRIKERYLSDGHKNIHGSFYIKNNISAYLSYFLFVYFNPIHYGQWIRKFPQKTNSLSDLEIEVFESLIKTFKGDSSHWTGFINSGASMGNFYSLLLCKNWFLSRGYKKINLVHTQLSHHSIISSAKILDFDLNKIKLTDKWVMDINKLKKNLSNLNKDEAVCIFLTWGYKKTGTSDKLIAIQNIIDELKINNQVCICLDAAFDGLITPFSPKAIKPLATSSLFTMTLDFHKYLGIPAPAGGILLRKNILPEDKFIAQGLSETKSLLPAIATWSSLVGNKQTVKLKKQIIKAQSLRDYFINQLKASRSIELIYHPSNISLLFSCNHKQFSRLEAVADLYPLRCFKQRNTYWIKIIFLPQLSKTELNKLLSKIL
jgi:glutamate/tyrosine decarboxylase-like PLP-dependent enzyme